MAGESSLGAVLCHGKVLGILVGGECYARAGESVLGESVASWQGQLCLAS